LVDIVFVLYILSKIKKATSRIVHPRWWPRNKFRAASSGAGYGDQNNNADYKELKVGDAE